MAEEGVSRVLHVRWAFRRGLPALRWGPPAPDGGGGCWPQIHALGSTAEQLMTDSGIEASASEADCSCSGSTSYSHAGRPLGSRWGAAQPTRRSRVCAPAACACKAAASSKRSESAATRSAMAVFSTATSLTCDARCLWGGLEAAGPIGLLLEAGLRSRPY